MSIDIVELNQIINSVIAKQEENYKAKELNKLKVDVEEHIKNIAKRGQRRGELVYMFPNGYAQQMENIVTITINYLQEEFNPIHFVDKEVQLLNGSPYSMRIEIIIPTIKEETEK